MSTRVEGLGPGVNYFEVFGLPRRLQLDVDDLQRSFYALSRRYHPDFHQGAPREAQAQALEMSAVLNAAYRALRDPIARVEYLIRLEDGRETTAEAGETPKAPPALLAEMFEIQETLEEAKRGRPDDAARAALEGHRQRLRARFEAENARLAGPLARAWDDAADDERPRVLARARQALATRAYLRTVIEDLSQALGDIEESRVSNRRH